MYNKILVIVIIICMFCLIYLVRVFRIIIVDVDYFRGFYIVFEMNGY